MTRPHDLLPASASIMANAFNCIDRAALLRAVYGNNVELAACWRMVSFGYGRSSLLLMRCDSDEVSEADAFIESSNGDPTGRSRTGRSAMAALLFALAMHSVYEQVARICRAGCFAYSDDGHGVGWLEECWRAWEALPALLEPLGLAPVNAGQVRADVLPHRGTAARAGHRRPRRLPCGRCDDQHQRTEGARLRRRQPATPPSRASCGSGPASETDQRAAFRRLPLLGKQTAYLALAQLTGTVLTNRLRAMSPASTEAHAVEHDQQVLSRRAHARGHRRGGWRPL